MDISAKEELSSRLITEVFGIITLHTTSETEYYRTISETIGKQLNKLNIKTSYKAYRNLKKIIGTPKDKPDKLEKSGVYKLTCDTCEGVYLGQTGRQLKTRIKEHTHS